MKLWTPWRTLLVSLATAVLASSVAGCGGSSAAPGDDGGRCMPVTVPTTCPSPPPSYKGEIQSIVSANCLGMSCHQKGGAESVKDFSTYQGLAADHLTVAQQVEVCLMPPPGYQQPTAAARLALVTWAVVCQAPNN